MTFYDNYARDCGFDTRKFGQKSNGNLITWQYIVCSKEGSNNDQEVSTTRKRRRRSKRCNCKAKISFKYFSDFGISGYVVVHFIEEHNHIMVDSEHKRFMSINRNLDHIQHRFMEDCAKANIGPTMTFNLLVEVMGGYDAVGCTLTDARNRSRDRKLLVEGIDAQMVVDLMRSKKETSDGFYFDFELNDERKLKRLFWCDEMSKRNYHMFGDVVAFDTTYSTNRYCMIFAPFTGKDNHGCPVTFASGLLSNEDTDSFTWLFTKFVDCMGIAPKLIVTDQDLGMRSAIERLLVGTRHRWCMWHIMLKLSEKVSNMVLANDQFKMELNACVWSDILEPAEFEDVWNDIMVTHGLKNNEWLKKMFEYREFWIPAYFRDFPMGSLIRTTSISESENSFYKRYTKPYSNLLDFMMKYNHALDAQRNQYSKMNYLDNILNPDLKTVISIEKHAASIYTYHMFKVVQAEIVEACYKCRVEKLSVDLDVETYKIIDGRANTWVVTCSEDGNILECGCKLFVRVGILCSHIFFVLKNKDIKLIPEKYFGSRWLKSPLIKSVHVESSAKLVDHTANDENRSIVNKLYLSFYRLVNKAVGNNDLVRSLTDAIDNVGRDVFGECSNSSPIVKKKMVEEFYGMQMPDVVDVHPPNVVKTKGSGSRLVSRREKAIRVANKQGRRCAKCHEIGNHDSRNCDKMKEKNKK